MHLPLLRHGEVYRSLDTAPVPEVGGPVGAEVSLATPGMLRRDLRRLARARAALDALPVSVLVEACVVAADRFLTAELPVGEGVQGFDAWVAACSASTGLPRTLVRAAGERIATALRQMPAIVRGLTRGLDGDVLDARVGEDRGVPVSFVRRVGALAAVLPSNSPSVHTLWVPALALKTPVVLKPGAGDPFTPLRVIEALAAAGVPREAFGYYPADHATGAELVGLHEAVLVFGGPDVARRYAGRPGVQVHGPGWSKVVLGPDVRWEDHLDLLVTSVAHNGGRSCINASTIVVPRGADDLARALGERLAAFVPRPLDDPDAVLAATDPAVAESVSDAIDAAMPGARDVSAEVRGTGRLARLDGRTWLLPTVVRTPPDHPLARTEYAFPFTSVVELDAAEAIGWLGPTLVLTLVSDDPDLRRAALDAPHVDRLHLGAVPTTAIRWDQPHEGNLFELLWRRRAVAW